MKRAPLALLLASLLVLAVTWVMAGSRKTGERPGAELNEDVAVGEPATFDNLTVFPVTSRRQIDVGPMTTLDAALAKGQAEVSELQGSGPRVNQLQIENKGDKSIYVLAGTIVKGGNQDRQIAQDFVIEPKKVVSVDAFCVEHGRWTAERDGKDTGGKFGALAQLAPSEVRAAAQYEKDQSQVWALVGATNRVHGKSPPSSTLMATVDDPEIVKERAALADRVNRALGKTKPANSVVGLAYAVDGKVRGVRWFASHAVFELVRPTLANTAAADALTAKAAHPADRLASAPMATASQKDVSDFIKEAEAQAVSEERDTAGANRNEYRESAKAHASRTMMKARAAGAASAVPISADVLAK